MPEDGALAKRAVADKVVTRRVLKLCYVSCINKGSVSRSLVTGDGGMRDEFLGVETRA